MQLSRKSRTVLFVALFYLFSPTANGQSEQERVGRKASLVLPPGVKIERDVTYCEVDGVKLKLDLYMPAVTDGKLYPVVIYVHGGGWQGGDKAVNANMGDFAEVISRGYLIASVNYRHAPKYKFPAQIEDLKCAVRFLRAHSGKYFLDRNRVGAWGGERRGAPCVSPRSNRWKQGF